MVRRCYNKHSRPTAAILDRQSVKSAGHGGTVGYDAAKQIKGRKRHLLVDTLGSVLGVAVTPANVTERDGAQLLLARVLSWFIWLRILWVDSGYTGEAFARWVKGLRPKLDVEVVKRSDDTKGFKVLPRRWVVERTFGWLQRPSLDPHRDDPHPTPQVRVIPNRRGNGSQLVTDFGQQATSPAVWRSSDEVRKHSQ